MLWVAYLSSKQSIAIRGDLVIITCASIVAAGKVVLLLLTEGLIPREHFRINLFDYDPERVLVTIGAQLPAQQVRHLHDTILAIPDTSMS
jgi:hypothetical protein